MLVSNGTVEVTENETDDGKLVKCDTVVRSVRSENGCDGGGSRKSVMEWPISNQSKHGVGRS